MEVYLSKIWRGYIGGWNAGLGDLGGWSLNNHHTYAPGTQRLYLGDGRQRRAENLSEVITTVAGTGATCSPVTAPCGDGGPATEARLYYPNSVAVGPDNSIYIADQITNRIRRVGPDGVITTVAGTGAAAYSGDGGPATQAELYHPGA